MADWTIFPFGKYKLEHFNEINDIKYLTWFIGQLNNDMQIKNCANAIILAVERKYKNNS